MIAYTLSQMVQNLRLAGIHESTIRAAVTNTLLAVEEVKVGEFRRRIAMRRDAEFATICGTDN